MPPPELGVDMQRRAFITLLGGATAAWLLAAQAQETGRTYRLGGLSAGPRDTPYFVAMFENLRRLGFIEGQNLTVDWHAFALYVDRVSDFAAELVNRTHQLVVFTAFLLQAAAKVCPDALDRPATIVLVQKRCCSFQLSQGEIAVQSQYAIQDHSGFCDHNRQHTAYGDARKMNVIQPIRLGLRGHGHADTT